MKPAALMVVLLLFVTSVVRAQLTLLPQMGFDLSKTNLQFNELSSFAPLGSKANIKAAIKMDYRFKGGHGPYVGVGTSPSVVEFSFAEPSTAMNDFKAAMGSMQWRVEAGYQYSFKPINFKKAKAATAGNKTTSSPAVTKKTCGSYAYKSHCGSQKKPAPVKQNLSMRIQPSVGVAYVPSVANTVISKGSSYQYNGGNWNTALVSAVGFEFGKGKERYMTVSLSYTKGLNNMGTQTISKTANGKTSTVDISSSSNTFGLAVGVPFNLIKNKKPVVKKTSCYQKTQIQYKSGCGKKSVLN